MLQTVDVKMVAVNNHPERIILMVNAAAIKKIKEIKEVKHADGI